MAEPIAISNTPILRDFHQLKHVLNNVSFQMKLWAESKNLPGQFTGSTGVQVLSQAELAGSTDPKKQAWVKKVWKVSLSPGAG